MTVHPIPKTASSFPRNLPVEEKVLDFLEKNKKSYVLIEVAEAVKEPVLATRRALLNLRNDGDIVIITFETSEINWTHKKHLPK